MKQIKIGMVKMFENIDHMVLEWMRILNGNHGCKHMLAEDGWIFARARCDLYKNKSSFTSTPEMPL